MLVLLVVKLKSESGIGTGVCKAQNASTNAQYLVWKTCAIQIRCVPLFDYYSKQNIAASIPQNRNQLIGIECQADRRTSIWQRAHHHSSVTSRQQPMTCHPKRHHVYSLCTVIRLPGPEPAKGHLSWAPRPERRRSGAAFCAPARVPPPAVVPHFTTSHTNTGDLSSCPPSPPRRLRSPFSFFSSLLIGDAYSTPAAAGEREREREERVRWRKPQSPPPPPLRPPPPAFRRASIGRARTLPSPFPRRDPARSSRAHCNLVVVGPRFVPADLDWFRLVRCVAAGWWGECWGDAWGWRRRRPRRRPRARGTRRQIRPCPSRGGRSSTAIPGTSTSGTRRPRSPSTSAPSGPCPPPPRRSRLATPGPRRGRGAPDLPR
jgi:hypothetical protein